MAPIIEAMSIWLLASRSAGDCTHLGRFREASEVHRQYLYRRKEITSLLEKTGFSATIRTGYGAFPLKKGHRVALAVNRTR